MEKWNAIEEGTQAEAGKMVYPDGWDGHGANLHDYPEWSKADFYLQGRYHQVAVNVTVTGRTFQRPWGYSGPKAVRVKIEFVGDGEPSTFSGGWMIL